MTSSDAETDSKPIINITINHLFLFIYHLFCTGRVGGSFLWADHDRPEHRLAPHPSADAGRSAVGLPTGHVLLHHTALGGGLHARLLLATPL